MPLSIKDDLPDIIPTYLSGIFIARPQKTIVGTKGYNLYSEICTNRSLCFINRRRCEICLLYIINCQ